MSNHNNSTNRARTLRNTETKSEKLLWTLLRNRQLCNLKFRRQHPVGPYFVDFACISHRLVIEINGQYHNQTVDQDIIRENYLRNRGWKVLRVSSQEAEERPDSVGFLIANVLNLGHEFRHRKSTIIGN